MFLGVSVYKPPALIPQPPEMRHKRTPLRIERPKKIPCENAKRKTELLTDSDEMDSEGKHYKKKLLQQHVRPPEGGGGVTASPFPVIAAQMPSVNGKGGECEVEGGMQAKRRRTSRSQFRHKDIELYKLGSPSSECKIK